MLLGIRGGWEFRVQKHSKFLENSVELSADKVNKRGLCAIAQRVGHLYVPVSCLRMTISGNPIYFGVQGTISFLL
ncbi:unnamed protein product [Ilex paraguariensis]|uniref:Uncharacterized protein n=1 Tax=Ilex paraguariensis TaxID=185542 RepID=A0ABC8T874_9AQUA